MYMYISLSLYIYIYREREREREIHTFAPDAEERRPGVSLTVTSRVRCPELDAEQVLNDLSNIRMCICVHIYIYIYIYIY